MKTPLLAARLLSGKLFTGKKLLSAVGMLAFFGLATGFAGAQAAFNFSPGGFSAGNVCGNGGATPPTGICQILTNGTPNLPTVTANGVLRLNTADTDQHASAWYYAAQPLNTGFTTAFQFTITNGNGPGDGMAFVIQGDPAGTGAIGFTANGHNLSYGDENDPTANAPGLGILNSLAVELDTYQNTEYGDPDGNHIAVQSCASTASALVPNSASHLYTCPNSNRPATLALQSLSGVPGLANVVLADGKTHTLTLNYEPPKVCATVCNNFSVYLDSVLVLQTYFDIQLQLSIPNNSAYVGFTSATGAADETNDIVSWSFSQLPLSPITITQPLQPATPTTFNFTPNLSATVDFSGSGFDPSGIFMQSTIQGITDQQYADLVNNTPFQGSTCLHQSLGNDSTGQPTYSCVTTTDLCTTSTNSTPAGANCISPPLSTPLIGVTNTYILDPLQKPTLLAPGYLMGKDTAITCGVLADNSCKGLINIFTSMTGDPTTTGRTKNFNSVFIPVEGVVQPSTVITTATGAPLLNNTWVNGPVTLTLTGTEVKPDNNHNPPSSLPAVSAINYKLAGVNATPSIVGSLTGVTGTVSVPAVTGATLVEGATVLTYSAVDTSGTPEVVITTDTAGNVSTSLHMLTINVDTMRPTASVPVLSSSSPVFGQALTASYSCADSASGVVLCGPAGVGLIPAAASVGPLVNSVDSTAGTHTFTVSAQDQAGNVSLPGSFVTYTVAKASTTTAITGNTPNPSNVGQAVVVSFAVTPSTNAAAPTGTVTVLASTGETCSAAVAAGGCSLTFNSSGSRTIVATYSGDGNFLNSTSSSVSQSVVGTPLSINPSSIAFGTVKKFHPAAVLITVKNPGTTAITFKSIVLTQTESDGGPGRQFAMLSGCGSKLAAGASCKVGVAFLATEVLSANGTITFTDSASNSPQTVSLSGTVVK